GDVDLAAGQGEGVDRPGVGEEVEVEVAGVGRGAGGAGADDPLAEGLEDLLVLRARELAAVLRRHLRLRLEAQGDLLVRVHAHALLLARDGVFLDRRREEVGGDGDGGGDEADEEATTAAAAAGAAPGADEHGGRGWVRRDGAATP